MRLSPGLLTPWSALITTMLVEKSKYSKYLSAFTFLRKHKQANKQKQEQVIPCSYRWLFLLIVWTRYKCGILSAPSVRVCLQMLVFLASSLTPFCSIHLHGPTHNQLCVHWLMVRTITATSLSLTKTEIWSPKSKPSGKWQGRSQLQWKTGKRRRLRENKRH